MQDNTKSEKPDNSDPDKEEIPSEPEETPENTETDIPESDPQFEEQEGEVLPPEAKKKSGAGKIFLFLVVTLAGSGAYLYSNNLIPPEILNLIDPKPAPRKTVPLIAKVPPTPLPVEKESSREEPVVIAEEIDAPSPEPSTGTFAPNQEAPLETPPSIEETHISGRSEEPVLSAQISGNKSDVGESIEPESKREESEVVQEQEEVQEPDKIEEDIEREVASEPEDTEEEIEQETPPESEETDEDVEQEVTQEPETEAIAPTVEAPPEPADTTAPSSDRSESTQAYLDFIESAMQKLGELILEGINFSWDYLKKKLG